MKRKITVHDVKQALLDERFRSSLPDELQPEVQKFLKNPGCACNHPLYLSVMRRASKQVADYFPTKDVPPEEEMEKAIERLAINNWQVINCNIHELEEKLRGLGAGRKQLDVARYQDQVTVIVNHLEGLI